MSTIKRVGFIGIGNMGGPMAGHLAKKGFDVTVFDLRRDLVERFAAGHGATAAATVADVARGADAVITMLPNDKIVRKAILGDSDDGAASALAKGAVVIDMSTSDPIGTRSLAEALAPRGIPVIDAPVMGGVIFAKDGTLDIMVGGEKTIVERCRPLFQAMGRSIMECGGVGTGHALKALANYVNACALINAVEAMAVGKKFGLDSKFMAEALIPLCAGRNHPIEKKVIPHVLTRKYGTGMALGFIAKDVKIAHDTAQAMGAFAPLAEKVSELWSAAADKLGAQIDQTEIARYWEEANGISFTDVPNITKS
jgi:3-hydroxyisobutyrate dehydrogenase